MANNGTGAVKFMRSVRSWAYKAFGSERALTLVAMATPEDMRMVGGLMHFEQTLPLAYFGHRWLHTGIV